MRSILEGSVKPQTCMGNHAGVATLFLSGEINFWSEGKLLVKDENVLGFLASYPRLLFSPSTFIPPPPASFYYIHTHKSRHATQPKKKLQTWGIYTLTLPQSICPASTVVTQSYSAFLTSWDCVPSCHFRHSVWCHFNCRWVVREKT